MNSVKFTFDDDFSEDADSGSYSKKIQRINDDAYLKGKEEGYSEALGSIDKNCEILLENISRSMMEIINSHEEQIILMEKNATSLVLAIIRKLAPAIVNDMPLKEIENLVSQCLSNNPLEPRVVIRIHEQILPLLRKKIDSIQAMSDYSGQIVLISEEMANMSDCRVEWTDGGAERDYESLMQSIEEMVQVFIDAPNPANGAAGNIN